MLFQFPARVPDWPRQFQRVFLIGPDSLPVCDEGRFRYLQNFLTELLAGLVTAMGLWFKAEKKLHSSLCSIKKKKKQIQKVKYTF